MSQSKYVEYTSRHIYTINANKSLKTIACVIQRSVRPLFSLVLLVVVVAILGCRVAIRNGFGSIYGDGDVSTRIWGYWSENNDQTVNNFQIFNSTLLELAEVELGEAKLREEIGLFLGSKFGNAASFRVFVAWRRLRGNLRVRTLSTMSRMPVNPESPEFITVWNEFRRCLGDWSEKNTFIPDILEDLVDNVKVPIDRHSGVLVGVKKKYSSCAVVGNSGILLSKEYGNMIDDHEVVIRLNNARIGSYQNNVGSKTNISFVNSNILHDCASEDDCFCHSYGANVPIVMYMCQPVQFLDYLVCNTSHKSPLIVTDPRFDMLCARIVKYYSLKRFANKTLEEWNLANDGSLFHYSSGMQAVTMALGMCDQVSLFGFGKSNHTKHHYHTNQTQELRLHDYEAEYDYYHALVNNPASIPFISEKFEFPPVIIHR